MVTYDQWEDDLMRAFHRLANGSKVSEGELSRVISTGWSRETSYDPPNWSGLNSAWGPCAVSALIVQDLLGGELLVGKVN